MSYENNKLMNLEDGHLLLEAIDNKINDEITTLNNKKADIDDLYTYKEASGSIVVIDDAIAEPIKQMQIEINPIQDLHGYDYPWPAGGGENIAPIMTLDRTRNGITFTTQTDEAGNIISYTANGTATGLASVAITESFNLVAGTVLTGCPSGGSYSDGYALFLAKDSDGTTAYYDEGSGTNINTSVQSVKLYILVRANVTVNNLVFRPMIRNATESVDFSPYTNICPISGWTECNVSRTGNSIYTTENSVDGEFINLDGTIGTNADFLYTDLIDVTDGSVIYAKMTNPGNIARWTRVHGYDASGVWVQQINATQIQINSSSEYSFTIPTGIKYIRISIAKSLTNISFELGKVYSITFPSSVGTVYGGTLTINRDGTGKLIVDKAKIIYNGTEAWATNTHADYSYYIPLEDGYDIWKCNWLKVLESGSGDTMEAYEIRMNAARTNMMIRLPAEYDTLEKAVALIVQNNIEVVYVLKNANSYDLTVPQVQLLLGLNNVWADTGDILSMIYGAGNILSIDYSDNIKFYIDKLKESKADKTDARIWYGTCETGASTQKKVATVANLTELIVGDVIHITFTNAQTYNGTPTLDINGFGAKNIRRLTGTNAARYEWNSGETITFVWNGTYFLIANGGFATTTYYGRTKLATSAVGTSTGLALTPASLNSFSQNTIANYPIYSASTIYAVGDRVRYSWNTWECITAIETAEAWNAAHWQALPSLQEQIDDLKESFNSIIPASGVSF